MKVRIAFYKCYNGNLLDWTIAIWTSIKLTFKNWRFTWMPYSHVELNSFSNGDCFSASPRDGGVRYKLIDITTPSWDVIELELNCTEEELRAECDKDIGKLYDFLGIFFYEFLSIPIEDPNKYWCSEEILKVLKAFGIPICDVRLDPNEMFLSESSHYIRKRTRMFLG